MGYISLDLSSKNSQSRSLWSGTLKYRIEVNNCKKAGLQQGQRQDVWANCWAFMSSVCQKWYNCSLFGRTCHTHIHCCSHHRPLCTMLDPRTDATLYFSKKYEHCKIKILKKHILGKNALQFAENKQHGENFWVTNFLKWYKMSRKVAPHLFKFSSF